MTTTLVKAGIIGHPVAHSRSPNIHGYWLRTYGIAGSYDRYPVKPEDLATFIRDLRENGLAGCNVTIPHKEAVMALCDEITPRAREIGAVNTLWFENGRLLGDNTDVMGFIASLDEAAPDWAPRTRRAVVLGAGGGAKGIIYGLAERGLATIDIMNRSRDRAEALVAEMQPIVRRFGTELTVSDWEDRSARLAGSQLLVNTTSLGMKGEPALEIDLSRLPASALVADIVYVPLTTPLLAQARARGLVGVDGLGMLLHQATPGFEKWFGRPAMVTPELRGLVEADIPKV